MRFQTRAMFLRSTVSAAVVLSLVGCGALSPSRFGPQSSLDTRDRLSVFGANPQFNNEPFEIVDLFSRLDPDNRRARVKCAGRSTDPLESAREKDRCELESAFQAFYDSGAPEALTARRNALQDRLIAASVQRCEAYKIYLKRFQSYTNTSFGVLTTILGGAGAITSHGTTARLLAGLAGISSGVNAEINEGFFASLATYVIVPGIETRRADIRKLIDQKRPRPIAEYTIEAALADAATFHGACTLESGLEQAQDLIKTAVNPGLSRVNETLSKAHTTRQLIELFGKTDVTPIIEADGTVTIKEVRIEAADGVGSRSLSGADARPQDDLLNAQVRAVKEWRRIDETIKSNFEENKKYIERYGKASATDKDNWNTAISTWLSANASALTDAGMAASAALASLSPDVEKADQGINAARLGVVNCADKFKCSVAETALSIKKLEYKSGAGVRLAKFMDSLQATIAAAETGIALNDKKGAEALIAAIDAAKKLKMPSTP